MKKIISSALLTLLAAQTLADPNPYVGQPKSFDGPFRGTVVRVIDADTISVSINLWPGSIQLADIRVKNIDAPETRTRCEAEKALGLAAKVWVEGMYPVGEFVRIDNVESDPFFGRVVADIRRWRSDRWLYLANELVERDFAEPWQPGQAEIDWCKIAEDRKNKAN